MKKNPGYRWWWVETAPATQWKGQTAWGEKRWKRPEREAELHVRRKHEKYRDPEPSVPQLSRGTREGLLFQVLSLCTAGRGKRRRSRESQGGRKECRRVGRFSGHQNTLLLWVDQGGQGWRQAIGGWPGWLSDNWRSRGKWWSSQGATQDEYLSYCFNGPHKIFFLLLTVGVVMNMSLPSWRARALLRR